MSLIAAGVIGAVGLAGSLLGGRSQAKASKTAQQIQMYMAAQQLAREREMHERAMQMQERAIQMQEPYYNIGTEEFADAFGYSPTGGGNYIDTGPGIDPTGGAGQYLNAMTAMDPNLGVDATGGAGAYAQQLGQVNPYINVDPTGGAASYAQLMEGADPTGGASKYLQQLEDLNFKLDPNDEVYKWRQEQTQRSINQAAAARGLYNSRPTINALSDADMALQESEVNRQFNQNYLAKQQQLQNLYGMSMGIGSAEYAQLADQYQMAMQMGDVEYAKAVDDYMRNYGQITDQYTMSKDLGAINYGQAQDQYNRQYGQNMDAYNMARQLGQTKYGKALDAIKAGQGAAGTMGENTMAMGANTMAAGQQIGSVYGNMGNAMASANMSRGQNTANTWQGLGNTALNAMAMYNLGNSGGGGNASSWMDNYNWSAR